MSSFQNAPNIRDGKNIKATSAFYMSSLFYQL